MMNGLIESLPLISIIMPTFNQAHYLKEAIVSVLSQTWPNWELIVINNFSQDNTEEVVRSFSDSRITLINFKNNGKIAASRNQGINLARGPYLAFLDSDDLWFPQKLEVSMEYIRAGADLVCHGQVFFDDEGTKERNVFFGPSKKAKYFQLLFDINPISTSTVLVRTDLVKNCGGFLEDDSAITAEDYDLWLRISKEGAKIEILHEILGKHRKHHSSNSSAVLRHTRAIQYVLDKHYQGIQHSGPALRWAYIRKKSQLLYGAARAYHDQGQMQEALNFFTKSLKTWPFEPRTYAGLFLCLMKKAQGK